eukprot:11540781-Ditylum_brightwellii.AAC.1
MGRAKSEGDETVGPTSLPIFYPVKMTTFQQKIQQQSLSIQQTASLYQYTLKPLFQMNDVRTRNTSQFIDNLPNLQRHI